MRLAVIFTALVLAGCSSHSRTDSAACTLAVTAAPVPATGEHSLAVRSSCAVAPYPDVGLGGIPFTFVPEGGAKGSHVVLFDKFRCDVRDEALAREVHVGTADLRMKTSLMDWCPNEAVSTVVHVYLGATRVPAATWRGVLRDIYDGRLDRVWPCGALRDAFAHLPVDGPTYSSIGPRLARAATPACDAAIAGIAKGAPHATVLASLGAPDQGGPRCLVWSWQPGSAGVDGARVCFAHGRATTIQNAVHG